MFATMNATNNAQLLMKGSLSVIILKLLEDRNRMYVYEITQTVKAMTKGALHPVQYNFAL